MFNPGPCRLVFLSIWTRGLCCNCNPPDHWSGQEASYLGTERITQDAGTSWVLMISTSSTLWIWKWKLLSCVQLFVTPWTIFSIEFSRSIYWSGQPFPSPGDLPNSGIEPRSPAFQADSLPAEPPGKPKNTGLGSLSFLQWIFPTTNWLSRKFNLN